MKACRLYGLPGAAPSPVPGASPWSQRLEPVPQRRRRRDQYASCSASQVSEPPVSPDQLTEPCHWITVVSASADNNRPVLSDYHYGLAHSRQVQCECITVKGRSGPSVIATGQPATSPGTA